jgi:hypothetical protein
VLHSNITDRVMRLDPQTAISENVGSFAVAPSVAQARVGTQCLSGERSGITVLRAT